MTCTTAPACCRSGRHPVIDCLPWIYCQYRAHELHRRRQIRARNSNSWTDNCTAPSARRGEVAYNTEADGNRRCAVRNPGHGAGAAHMTRCRGNRHRPVVDAGFGLHAIRRADNRHWTESAIPVLRTTGGRGPSPPGHRTVRSHRPGRHRKKCPRRGTQATVLARQAVYGEHGVQRGPTN